MNNEQILKKAITKAIKNGWKHDLLILDDGVNGYVNDVCCGDDKKLNDGYMSIIYSIDFAKNFWGEKKDTDILICSNPKCKDREKWSMKVKFFGTLREAKKHLKDFPYCATCGKKIHIEKTREDKENYKTHLQQMVIQENPLKYIEQYL